MLEGLSRKNVARSIAENSVALVGLGRERGRTLRHAAAGWARWRSLAPEPGQDLNRVAPELRGTHPGEGLWHLNWAPEPGAKRIRFEGL